MSTSVQGTSQESARPPPQQRDSRPRQRSRPLLRQVQAWLIFALTLFGLIGAWQYSQTQIQAIPPLYLPPPSAVWSALEEHIRSGTIQRELRFSFQNYAVGLAVGATVGITVGLVAGGVRRVSSIVSPYVWALYSTPSIAFQPILIVALGFGPFPKIIVIFLGVIFPIIINTMAGVQTVDQTLVRAARVFGATRVQLFLRVALPFAIPFILTGLRLGAARGLLYMYVSELYGSTRGLGFFVLQATNRFDTPTAFGGIIVLVCSSIVVIKSIEWLEHRIAAWRSVPQV